VDGMLRNWWTACSGISGRHAPELVDGMLRILHPGSMNNWNEF
jgi:hypothetical protein